MIVEKEAREILSEFPSDVLVTLYAIAIFHEKYIFAKWVCDILYSREITPKYLTAFKDNFTGFYEDLLNQEGL